MLNIHKESDLQRLTQQAADAVVDCVGQYKKDSVLLLFSGGSPLEVAKILPVDLFDSQVTIGVSDERFSTDPTINNFAQVCAMNWYEQALSAGMQIIDTRPQEKETLEVCASRFNEELKEWKTQHPNGKIVITQGIGLDGHTSGMMPYPEDPEFFIKTFIDTTRWIVGYDAQGKNKYPKRITTTVPFLLLVDKAIVFVCGNDKQIPAEHVFNSQQSLPAVPGRVVHQMKSVEVFTDRSW